MDTDELFIDGHKLPKPLKKEEVYDLIDKMKHGDTSAREKLIEHNIRLVLYEVTGKFKSVEYDKKDLVSIGNVGLMKAINTFDTSKKVEFATYATRCIDNEILMFLRKIKRDQNIDSFDRVINQDKEGNDLKIEDILKDDIDIAEEYNDNETYQIIRKIVSELPKRDKEIVIMHFGFVDNRRYTQREIATKLQISQSYVSRLIGKVVKELGYKLEAQGLIELREKEKKVVKKCTLSAKNREKKEMARELQTIYKYFNQYTKEQVDTMLSKLNDDEKKLITCRYGEDLEVVANTRLTKEETNKFYGSLIPKMKRLLANPNQEKKERKKRIITQRLKSKTDEEIIKMNAGEGPTKEKISKQEDQIKISKELERNSNDTELENSDMTKEDCVKMLALLRTPTFSQMLTSLTVKEAVIISLRLGYVNEKAFSTEAIAGFLQIDEEEVRETTKKVLLVYKDNINNFLDNVIETMTKGPILSKK